LTRRRAIVGVCGAFLYWEAARAFVNDKLMGGSSSRVRVCVYVRVRFGTAANGDLTVSTSSRLCAREFACMCVCVCVCVVGYLAL